MLPGDFMHDHGKGIGLPWYLGLRHGGFILGCCWALMLVIFGLEVRNLAGMTVLTAVMVIEQTVSGGRYLSSFVGIVLLLLGLLWLAHPIWFRSVTRIVTFTAPGL